MKAPDKLRLDAQGQLYIDNGNHCSALPDEYLAAWAKKRGMTDGEPVCVIRRDDLQRMYDELLMQRDCILCA